MSDLLDVIVVGAGPAGLSAALVLGRCCRRVLVCDSGRPRNAASGAVNGFLTRDGTSPGELRRLGREQLARFATVEVRATEVVDARREHGAFALALGDGARVASRRLLLATGLVDDLPPIQGLSALWGKAAFPCPYCDAWEVRGKRLGALGSGDSGLALCRALLGWSPHVTLFANGDPGLDDSDLADLAAAGVAVVPGPVLRLEADGDRLTGVRGVEGTVAPCDALFVSAPQHQRSPLVAKLGCRLDDRGVAVTGEHESTNVPGLFVAGDASRNVQFAIVAAAEGAEAAFEINRSLCREEFRARCRSRRGGG